MHIIIFTTSLNNAKRLGAEIVDKIGNLAVINVEHNGTVFKLPQHDITIDIRIAILAKTGGLRPDYYLLDERCSYDFCESIPYCLERKGNERLFSMRHLIMKIVEIILYGKEEVK